MHTEVQVALNFILSYLHTKLPRRKMHIFCQQLGLGIMHRFEGHWYPERPSKGSAFRALPMSDELVGTAALNSGLLAEDVRALLPPDLTLWVDPGEVSYRLSEKGGVKVIYKHPPQSTYQAEVHNYPQIASTQITGHYSPPPIYTPPSPTRFHASPSPPPVATLSHQGNHSISSASFAQTKFGSLKPKYKASPGVSQRASASKSPPPAGVEMYHQQQRALFQQLQAQLQQSVISAAAAAAVNSGGACVSEEQRGRRSLSPASRLIQEMWQLPPYRQHEEQREMQATQQWQYQQYQQQQQLRQGCRNKENLAVTERSGVIRDGEARSVLYSYQHAHNGSTDSMQGLNAHTMAYTSSHHHHLLVHS